MNREPFLRNGDVQAIVRALPLVPYLNVDTPQQANFNAMFCASAGQKLLDGATNFDPNEIRVISAAVSAAVLLLSGKSPDLFVNVDNELRSSLSGYYFTLNRLAPIFSQMVFDIGSRS